MSNFNVTFSLVTLDSALLNTRKHNMRYNICMHNSSSSALSTCGILGQWHWSKTVFLCSVQIRGSGVGYYKAIIMGFSCYVCHTHTCAENPGNPSFDRLYYIAIVMGRPSRSSLQTRQPAVAW